MRRSMLALLFLATFSSTTLAQDKSAPLKALLITGGGFHNYKALNPVKTEKISELANITFDVKYGLDVLKDPSFAKGYDVLIYNFCFANEKNMDLIANALKATRDGKPTVMIHCAMHTFMASDEWTDCCGMRTRKHDPYRAFSVLKVNKDHPIVQTLPDEWPTPGDELYQTIQLGERSTALLKGKAPNAKEDHIICWVSQYGQGKVFATTLGHDLKTVNLPEYHKLLASGILWSAGKLGKDGKPLPGYGGK